MKTNAVSQTVKILVADNRQEIWPAVQDVLDDPSVDIVQTSSAHETISCLDRDEYALLFISVRLPDMDGIELTRRIQTINHPAPAPIILIANKTDPSDLSSKGYRAGVVDILSLPLNPDAVKGKVRVFLDLYRQKQSMEQATRELNKSILDLNNYRKIIEHKNNELRYFSSHDELTGLMNRRVMEEILIKEFDGTKRYGSDLSCILFDLDFFKEINDNYGHACGDYVLKEFSRILERNLRDIDYSFRYGGEEFLVLLPQTGIGGAVKSAEKIRKVCADHSFQDGIQILRITVSAGVASVNHSKPDIAWDLATYSDQALYRAKAEGRNRVKVHQIGKTTLSDPALPPGKGSRYFHEKLSFILEKTKRASLESIELLTKDMGGEKFQDHSRRVLHYLENIGNRLQLPPTIVKSIKRAALIHDSLKILMDTSIAEASAILSPEQRAVIEDHPYMLAELTELFDFFANEREVLLHHHENFDGSGYPQGLHGQEIPFGARLFSLADAVVAMTSDRPYRKKMTREQVMQELQDNAGTQFDPDLVSLFLEHLRYEDPSNK